MEIDSVKNIKAEINYKNLLWFYIASVSLLVSGFIISYNQPLLTLFTLIWCIISGLFLIYRFNDYVDQDVELRFNIYHFLYLPLNLIMFLQLIFITIPITVYLIEKETLYVLSLSSILGFLYSINFQFNNRSFKLKNVFFVKNALIGIVWGSLVLIGSNNIFQTNIIPLFLYASIQVFIGGVIRDIPDLKKDKSNNVKSFPVVLGTNFTINILHLINFMSIILIFFNYNNLLIFTVFLIPFIWRSCNLLLLNSLSNNLTITEWMNLFTCVLILISTIISAYFIK
tara:strand:- start:808 stop:1659 length:852 start_codon:yes stop_codon:yes gene_type:complete